MQRGNDAASVHLLAAARTVAEPYDVGAARPQSGGERQVLGVIGKVDEAFLTVWVISHEDRKFSTGHQSPGAVVDEQTVAFEEGR